MTDPRSRIPSVDRLLAAPGAIELIDVYGRPRVVAAMRGAVDQVRREWRGEGPGGGAFAADPDSLGSPEPYISLARMLIDQGDVPSLRAVVNATGVVLHTNLGRAPLAEEAVEAMTRAAREYTNLEFDLGEGVRGSRYVHCVSLLTELTGAEDALVVNNAAGALVLALNTAAVGDGVAVSRGELVEIGGGFRIPEVLERAGARLVEVGSTNRTRAADYRGALADGSVRALLKVHRSNFRMTGFTEEASLAELVALANEGGVPLIHDLGSGLMVDASAIGLPDEPRADGSIAAGVDVVVISGDKLLGGPQAGIVLGRSAMIEAMRRNPLCRALRVDKGTLAALEATLRLYRDSTRAVQRIPTLRMLAASEGELEERARSLAVSVRAALGDSDARGVVSEAVEGGATTPMVVEVVSTNGAVGGGTYPGLELPSWAVELRAPGGIEPLAAALRNGEPAVIGRIVDDALRLDVRTVMAWQTEAVARRVAEAAHRGGASPGQGAVDDQGDGLEGA